MNKIIRRLLSVMFLLSGSVSAFAQDAPDSLDAMRGNGKIYVVVAVCLTILVGLFIYVFIIDRKVSRLEKESK